MNGLVLASILAATGCGRLAFDAQPSARVDAAASDAPSGSFDPVAANCATANAGPFVEVGRFTTLDAARGIWWRDGYILVASAFGGLQSLTFDGSTFVERDRVTDIGWVETLWPDGDLLYVSAPGTGVTVVRLEADGSLTPLAEDRTFAIEARQGWGDGQHIYMPNGGDGLVALQFDGTAIAQVGSTLASQSWAEGGWTDGTYHYFADSSAVRVLTFDGSSFVDVAALSGEGGYTRVWHQNGALFTSHNGGLTAFAYDGANLTTLDTVSSHPTGSMFVWADGVHIFISGGMSGTYAYSFAGGALQQVDVANTTGDNLQVIGDGTYIYVAGMESQVIAYSGFACTSTR